MTHLQRHFPFPVLTSSGTRRRKWFRMQTHENVNQREGREKIEADVSSTGSLIVLRLLLRPWKVSPVFVGTCLRVALTKKCETARCCIACPPASWFRIFFSTPGSPALKITGASINVIFKRPSSFLTVNPFQENVINTSCGFGVQKLPLEEAARQVWTVGCIQALITVLEANVIPVSCVISGIAVLQLLAILLAKTLCTQIADQLRLLQHENMLCWESR
uniref:Uncharacterized protein n=1 Tax=Schistocephalus solidus TaxID=70667 RepID=A0A0X3NP54_SCHSO